MRRLLGRVGLRQEAELREADFWKGEWTTLCIYAVLAHEWPAMALSNGKVIDVLARGPKTFVVIRIAP